MKVFISWSGLKSQVAAKALWEWLPNVIQSLQPWMSNRDISAGSRWNRELSAELEQTKFGVICLTKTNLVEPWIHFEAGAISKTVDQSFVCPYLIDLDPIEVPSGPLTQFQMKRADQTGTFELLESINLALLPDKRLSESQLKKTFDVWYPQLSEKLTELPNEPSEPAKRRTTEDMVHEILDTVRLMSANQKSAWESGTFYELTNDLLREVRRLRDIHKAKNYIRVFGAPESDEVLDERKHDILERYLKEVLLTMHDKGSQAELFVGEESPKAKNETGEVKESESKDDQ